MEDRQASHTALVTAHLRAAHQLFDGEPRLLEDPTAVRLLGEHTSQRIHGAEDRFQSPQGRALRSHVVLRSRFAEDRLAAAVARGVRQYVILGAGFDTFAMRQPAWAQDLRIVEVDRPTTQALKREYLAEAGLALPANLTLAPVELGQEPLSDALARHGVRLDEPTFFSWLGVTMYLEAAAIDAVLQAMAACPVGSEVVLTYLQPPEADSPRAAAASAEMAQHVAAAGEPFVSYFEPAAMTARLLAAGFTTVEHLLPEQADELYYRSRPPDLPVPRRTGIAAARR